MLPDQPSQTAQRAALRRAAHQVLDQPPLVLEDPLAMALAGVPDLARFERNLRRGQNANYRHLRAFLVARSRFMEDRLRPALAAGLPQYLLLGAGLDSSPYRLHLPAALRIFELDAPASQAGKRERLRAAGIPEPPQLTYLPLDFERDDLAASLRQAGFSFARPAFIAWLGVTPYLTRAAIFATLDVLAALPAGSQLVLDYAADGQPITPQLAAAHQAMRQRLARLGEPWLSSFLPGAFHAQLHRRGWRVLEDLDSDAINQNFLARRADGLATAGLGRLLHAQRHSATAHPGS